MLPQPGFHFDPGGIHPLTVFCEDLAGIVMGVDDIHEKSNISSSGDTDKSRYTVIGLLKVLRCESHCLILVIYARDTLELIQSGRINSPELGFYRKGQVYGFAVWKIFCGPFGGLSHILVHLFKRNQLCIAGTSARPHE